MHECEHSTHNTMLMHPSEISVAPAPEKHTLSKPDFCLHIFVILFDFGKLMGQSPSILSNKRPALTLSGRLGSVVQDFEFFKSESEDSEASSPPLAKSRKTVIDESNSEETINDTTEAVQQSNDSDEWEHSRKVYSSSAVTFITITIVFLNKL